MMRTIEQAGKHARRVARDPRLWTLAFVTIAASACGREAPPAVATVALTPSSASVVAGTTLALSAATRDAQGAALTDRTITWSTSSASVATVSLTGVVTAVTPGTAVTIVVCWPLTNDQYSSP